MEAIRSSETSVNKIPTRRHIPEDGIFHSYRRENLKSHNTQENSLIKFMQASFTRFETMLSKQAEQMTTLMNLLTAVLNRLVK
jgi:hypothetical protein